MWNLAATRYMQCFFFVHIWVLDQVKELRLLLPMLRLKKKKMCFLMYQSTGAKWGKGEEKREDSDQAKRSMKAKG